MTEDHFLFSRISESVQDLIFPTSIFSNTSGKFSTSFNFKSQLFCQSVKIVYSLNRFKMASKIMYYRYLCFLFIIRFHCLKKTPLRRLHVRNKQPSVCKASWSAMVSPFLRILGQAEIYRRGKQSGQVGPGARHKVRPVL